LDFPLQSGQKVFQISDKNKNNSMHLSVIQHKCKEINTHTHTHIQKETIRYAS